VLLRAALLTAAVTATTAVFLLAASPASAHQSGCHAAYSCPSDRHTYVWYSPQSQQSLDCVSGTNYSQYGRGTETVSFG